MPPQETYASIVERPVFIAGRRPVSGGETEGTSSTFDLEVVGIVVSDGDRFVLVKTPGGDQPEPVREGQVIAGGRSRPSVLIMSGCAAAPPSWMSLLTTLYLHRLRLRDRHHRGKRFTAIPSPLMFVDPVGPLVHLPDLGLFPAGNARRGTADVERWPRHRPFLHALKLGVAGYARLPLRQNHGFPTAAATGDSSCAGGRKCRGVCFDA